MKTHLPIVLTLLLINFSISAQDAPAGFDPCFYLDEGCGHSHEEDGQGTVTAPNESTSKAPLSAEYGYDLAPRGTVRVLIVFAETDCTPCGDAVCDNPDPGIDARSDQWNKGELPFTAYDETIFRKVWFDQALAPG